MGKARKRRAGILRADPTRTSGIARRMAAAIAARWRAIARDAARLIDREDVFGLRDPGFLTNARQFAFATSAEKVAAFRTWLREQVVAKNLTPDNGDTLAPWTADFIESSYIKGLQTAYRQTHAKEYRQDKEAKAFFEGGRQQFLRNAFPAKVRTARLEMLGSRAFTKLQGITAEIDTKLTEQLLTGFANGKNPRDIGREISKTITEISRVRAERIARTEIIHVHAEGQLDGYEAAGIKEIEVEPEWLTAGDNRVCPRCAEKSNKKYTIASARGLIPLHPNCRCMWRPARVGKHTVKDIKARAAARRARTGQTSLVDSLINNARQPAYADRWKKYRSKKKRMAY